jgi:hypothetical protein
MSLQADDTAPSSHIKGFCRVLGELRGTLAAVAVFAVAVAPAHAAKPDNAAEAIAAVYAAAAAGTNQYCAIMLVGEGQIHANPGNTELSSRAYGGYPGEADVISTNSSFQLSIDPVLGFSSAPQGAADGTSFVPSYSGNGATSFSDTPGNVPIHIKKGTTRVQVNFRATKTGTGFPAGRYRADLTLRCE